MLRGRTSRERRIAECHVLVSKMREIQARMDELEKRKQ
jgi:hypothetical protein